VIPTMANTRERSPRSDHRLVGLLGPDTCVGHIQRTLEPIFPSRQRGGLTAGTRPALCQTPNKDPGLSGVKHRRRRTLTKTRLLQQANRKARMKLQPTLGGGSHWFSRFIST
jgi:hypothetical protein